MGNVLEEKLLEDEKALIKALDAAIKFISDSKNNIKYNKELKAAIVKDLEDYKKSSVDIITYNYQKLKRRSASLFHPDIYNTLPSEALKKEIGDRLGLINGKFTELDKDIKEAKRIGLKDCFREQVTNNGPEQKTDDRQFNYQKNNNAGGRQYYGNPNQNNNAGGRSYSEDQEGSYYYYDDDIYGCDFLERFFKYVGSRFNAHIKKIPSNVQDFEKIRNIYLRRLKSCELKIGNISNDIAKCESEIARVKKQWETDLFPNNVQRIYREEQRKLYDEVAQARAKMDGIYIQLQQRRNILYPLISQRQQAFRAHADSVLRLYNEEMYLVQNGENTQLYNSIYPGTKKTYAEVLWEMYALLNSWQDMPKQLSQIDVDTCNEDNDYCAFNDDLKDATDDFKKIEEKYRNYVNDPRKEMQKIVHSMNSIYNRKLRGLNSNLKDLRNKLQRYTEKQAKIQEQYDAYLSRYGPIYGDSQRRGGR